MISQRLKDSFIDLNDTCSKKAREHYNFKETSLVSSAERVVLMGICFDDGYADPILKDYFYKLKEVFDDSFRVTFYINSDFVFFFEEGILTNIHPVHTHFRSHIQKVWLSNKANYDNLSVDEKMALTDERINNFKIDNGIEDEAKEPKVDKTMEEDQDFGETGWWDKMY